MMKTKYSLFLKLIGSLFALAVLAVPLGAAALTITQVEVIVGGAVYCDTSVAQPVACTHPAWNLGLSGVTLNTGDRLILTQTGNPAQQGGENFDTSDRDGQLIGCSTAGGTPCTVQIYINGVLVVNDPSGNLNALTAFNQEPTTDLTTVASTLFQEAIPWIAAPTFTGTGYALDLGYADNIHGGSCPATAAAASRKKPGARAPVPRSWA